MQPPARCSNHRCIYIDQCDVFCLNQENTTVCDVIKWHVYNSSNTSASCSLEVRHFGNLPHRVHLRISNVCNFFISERKHKVWVVISYLDRNEHFGTNLEFFVFVSRSSSFSFGRQKRYATSSHVQMTSFVNVCDVKSAEKRYAC